jgi:hypothetical protein
VLIYNASLPRGYLCRAPALPLHLAAHTIMLKLAEVYPGPITLTQDKLVSALLRPRPEPVPAKFLLRDYVVVDQDYSVR